MHYSSLTRTQDIYSTERGMIWVWECYCKTQGQICGWKRSALLFHHCNHSTLVRSLSHPGPVTCHLGRCRTSAHCPLHFLDVPYTVVSLNSERLPIFWCIKGFSALNTELTLTPGVSCARVGQNKDQCSLDLEVRSASNWTWKLDSQPIRCWNRDSCRQAFTYGNQLSVWEAAALSEECLCPYALCSWGYFLRMFTKYHLWRPCLFFFLIPASFLFWSCFRQVWAKNKALQSPSFP